MLHYGCPHGALFVVYGGGVSGGPGRREGRTHVHSDSLFGLGVHGRRISATTYDDCSVGTRNARDHRGVICEYAYVCK